MFFEHEFLFTIIFLSVDPQQQQQGSIGKCGVRTNEIPQYPMCFFFKYIDEALRSFYAFVCYSDKMQM